MKLIMPKKSTLTPGKMLWYPHTKANELILLNRIIKDFYMREPERKPKIFGMTASPVDAKVEVVNAAKYVLLTAEHIEPD